MIFFIILFILIPRTLTKKNILLSILVSIIFSILDYHMDGISLIAVFFTTILFLKKTKYSLSYKLFYFIFLFITNSIAKNISYSTAFNSFKFGESSSSNSNFLLPTFLAIIINFLLSIIATILYKSILSKKFNIFNFYDKTIKTISLISSLIILISYGYLMLMFKHLDLRLSYLKTILILSMTIIIFVVIGTVFLILSHLKEIKINTEKKQIMERNTYIKELERKNNELRRFKHDYKNFLLSLSTSLNSNNVNNDAIQKLLKYADTNIDSNLTVENSNLYHMNDELIRGIIITKLMLAKDKNIKTNFEIEQNTSIPKEFSVEVTRILGILLDNAIDACSQTDNPELDFALVSFDDHIEFIVKNSIANKSDIDLGKIYNNGYTTKNNHSGLGLSTVKKMIDANSKMLLQTKIDDKFFTIILTVLGEA